LLQQLGQSQSTSNEMGCNASTAANGVEDPQPETQEVREVPKADAPAPPKPAAPNSLAPSAALKASKVPITVSPDIDAKLDLSDTAVYQLNIPKKPRKVDDLEEVFATKEKKGFSKSEEDLMADIVSQP